MRYAFALALILSARSWAVDEFRLGGTEPWATWTGQLRMMDDATDPSVLQPRELKPGENLLPQLGPWYRWRSPGESTYRVGDVRIWRGINYLRPRAEPRDFIDGDPATFFAAQAYSESNEFYTIDLGVSAPVNRFTFYPPEGRDALTQEPYRPNFAFAKYELSGSLDPVGVAKEEGTHYRPLDILLASVDLNTEAVVNIEFPLQYLRFLRILLPRQRPVLRQVRLGRARGIRPGIPAAGRVDVASDRFKQTVNIGRVRFGASKWRREGDQLAAAPRRTDIRASRNQNRPRPHPHWLSRIRRHRPARGSNAKRIRTAQAAHLALGSPGRGLARPQLTTRTTGAFGRRRCAVPASCPECRAAATCSCA